MARRYTPLRLLAADAEDLAIVSAAVQDAVAKIGDFEVSLAQGRFTLAVNRYVWEASGSRMRVRTGLQAGEVVSAKALRLRQDAKEAVVNLLSIEFEAGEAPPAGELVLTFSGGGELRLGVKCLDIALADLSEPWPAAGKPRHKEAR